MRDDIDAIIKEVASKNGTALSPDDPIMVLHTIVMRLLQDAEKSQQTMLDGYKEELELIALRWGEDAKTKAERILNAALTASKEAMREATQDCARAASESVSEAMEAAVRKIAEPIKVAHRLTKMNIVCAVFTCIAAAITLWSGLR